MKYIVLSTTSKKEVVSKTLPDKWIDNNFHENYLVGHKEYLNEILNKNIDKDIFYIADCEKKQSLSLYDEVLNSNSCVIDYKPNDLTMEAADLAILNYFNGNISNKSIGIYGTGNIAFKLALRLSERNAKVYIFGRNNQKISLCVEALKQITFDESLVFYGDNNSRVDAFVSFVGAESVVTVEYTDYLSANTLCIDGGIGNFSKEFIETALTNGHDVRRLDVRQSQEIMDGYINSRLGSQFNRIIGRNTIGGYSVVAGGIIGQEGEVIIDRIVQPTRVIGIANGIGGVKNESNLNAEEHTKIKEVQRYIEQYN